MRVTALASAIIWALSLPAFATDGAAFNLVCSGENYMANGVFGPKEHVVQSTTIYRIDLDSGRWCSGTCETTKAVVTFSATEIILTAVESAPGFDQLTTINRESGDWLDRSRALPLILVTTGKCEKAAFSGFPTPKF